MDERIIDMLGSVDEGNSATRCDAATPSSTDHAATSHADQPTHIIIRTPLTACMREAITCCSSMT